MDTKMVTRKFIKSSLLVLFIASSYASAGVVLVGSSDVPELTEKQIKKIFLKKMSTLPNGKDAYPIDLTDDLDVKWEFYKEFTGKRPAQVHAYWSRALFSGLGNPPEQVDSVIELKQRLESGKGVVGYIDEKDLEPSMNVLYRLNNS